MRRIIRQKNRGYTLVEMIASFAVLLILMSAVLMTLTPALKVYERIRGMANAQNVSEMLFDKIDDELGNALVMEDTSNSSKISYQDKKGNSVWLQVGEDRKLHFLYQVYDEAAQMTEETDWYFPPSSYMNEEIRADEDIQFRYNAGKRLMEVTLKLTNTQTGFTYERTRMIKLHHLEAE